MKVAVIGGSAQSTPSLFVHLRRSPHARQLDFVLWGRSAPRLAAVLRASRLLAAGRVGAIRSVKGEAGLEDALEGATVVLLQIRVGGYSGRVFDESMPLRFGLCGDQEIGPGGLSAGRRAWPTVERILSCVARRAPSALVVVLSAPTSLLVRASRLRFPSLTTIGICELPWTTAASVARRLGAPLRRVQFRYHGVNHFGWFHEMRCGERDLVAEYQARSGSCRALDGICTPYVRLEMEREQCLTEQRSRPQRGRVLEEQRARLMPILRRGSRTDVQAALRARATPWYPSAIAPLLLGLAGASNSTPLFLSLPNEGACDQLATDDVLEVPHVIEHGALRRHPASTSGIPQSIARAVARHVGYQRLGARAIVAGRLASLERALASHPWITSRVLAARVAREIADAAPRRDQSRA